MEIAKWRGYRVSTSTAGAFRGCEVAASSVNTADSATFRRITSPIATSTALSTNGIRQPQARNSAVGSVDAALSTSVATIVPAGAPM